MKYSLIAFLQKSAVNNENNEAKNARTYSERFGVMMIEVRRNGSANLILRLYSM